MSNGRVGSEHEGARTGGESEIGRSREPERFEPVVEGARHGLSREISVALWVRACSDATDRSGRHDLEQALQRFHALAAHLAAPGAVSALRCR